MLCIDGYRALQDTRNGITSYFYNPMEIYEKELMIINKWSCCSFSCEKINFMTNDQTNEVEVFTLT